MVESLSGLIERVTFSNEETGFAVLQVKVRGHRELVTVVGPIAAPNPGEWLTAEGRWVQDRQFGRQFRADLLKSVPPTTREGIERYLGSGMVRGIGPVYARKLVERFGAKIFEIIEQESARLEQVEGIGPERRRRIKAAWEEQKVVREIMVFLHSHGVSTSRAARIYKCYGEKAIAKVRADPYGLARDIPGIGFKTADQIAQRVGIPHDSVMRAAAGLSHVLYEATNRGHCALPPGVLREEAARLLDAPPAVLDSALERALASGELVLDQSVGEPLVFLPSLRRAEEDIAARIRRLAALPPSFPAVDFEKALAWWEQKAGKVLAPSQRAALREALRHRLLVLTGGPGVGKTTLLNAILAVLRAKNVSCLLCAPTGRAAKRLAEATGLEARTIHRLLEVEPGRGGFLRNETRPLAGELLVVDEASMLDLPLAQNLLRALPAEGSLLLSGDVDQLPSVGPGTFLRDVIASGVAPVVRLVEVFRQAARSRIITNSHRINQGLMPELPEGKTDSDFYFIERETPGRIVETIIDLLRHRIPARFQLDPLRDLQVLTPMNRGALGAAELNLRLARELNPGGADDPVVEKFGWRFRAGDKVIQTENDYDKNVFNGDIGRVLRVDPAEREVVVTFDGREARYDFGELDELALAYAITIHKSQGSEFPGVIIPVAAQHYVMLRRNLFYTAITRGRRLVVLVGQGKALAMAVRNHQGEERYSGLLARLRNGLPGWRATSPAM